MFVLILFLVLGVLIVAGSCATRKIAISDEDLSNAYTGTWINSETTYEAAKIVYFPDGSFNRYVSIHTDYASCKVNNTIINKWKDSNGNIFFESKWECVTHGHNGYNLVKISDSGDTLEMLLTLHDLRVEEWEPDNLDYTYYIYYRQ